MGVIDRVLAALTPKARICPGCGLELIRWEEVKIRQGTETTRIWTGCPESKRLMDQTSFGRSIIEHFADLDRHYAKWVCGATRPLHDTETR